jgi:ATP-dependent Lon protease
MPSYTDDEKIFIAKTFMFPQVLTESGLTPNDLIVNDDTWEDIVRPLGYDSGIRSLKRVVQGMVRRAALLMLEGKIPQNAGFRISRENVKSFLPQW